jgi:hypothetical protein
VSNRKKNRKTNMTGHPTAQVISCFHHGNLGAIPGEVMWDLLLTKWHWGSFSPSTSVSTANSHSTNCSNFINQPITNAIIVDTDIAIK